MCRGSTRPPGKARSNAAFQCLDQIGMFARNLGSTRQPENKKDRTPQKHVFTEMWSGNSPATCQGVGQMQLSVLELLWLASRTCKVLQLGRVPGRRCSWWQQFGRRHASAVAYTAGEQRCRPAADQVKTERLYAHTTASRHCCFAQKCSATHLSPRAVRNLLDLAAAGVRHKCERIAVSLQLATVDNGAVGGAAVGPNRC